MIKSVFTIFLTLISIGFSFTQNTANSILGQWHNEDSTQVVEFKKEGNVYNAKLVYLDKENSAYILDVNNNDDTKKHRKVIGSKIWTGFEYVEDKDMWKYGEIYNYTNGNTYTGKIQIEGNELKLTGYYGFFFFLAKSQKWYSTKK